MERQTMIERSAAAIGQPYTKELHDAWVRHVAAVEEAYQALIRRKIKTMAESYHHSPVDPEAAEI